MVEYIVLVLGFILLFVPGGFFADIFLAIVWYVCTKNNQYKEVRDNMEEHERRGDGFSRTQAESERAWLEKNKYQWWRFGAWKRENNKPQHSIFTVVDDHVEVDCRMYGLNTTLIFPKPFRLQDYKEGERYLVENDEWLKGSCIYYREEGSDVECKFFCNTYDEANELATEMMDSYKFWGFGQLPTKVCIERENVESHFVREIDNNGYPHAYVYIKYSAKKGTNYGAYQLMTYAIQNKKSDSQMRMFDFVKEEPYLYYKHFIDKLMQKQHEQKEQMAQIKGIKQVEQGVV